MTLRRLILGVLAFMALLQLWVIEGVRPEPCQAKPSPVVASDPIFHREAIQVETETIGGEKYEPKFLEKCPAGRNCI